MFWKYDIKDFSLQNILLANPENLEKNVKFLSENNRTSEVGQKKIVQFIQNELNEYGVPVENIEFQLYKIEKREYKNIIVHFSATDRRNDIPKYVIGTHYDSFIDLPGADDNASGVGGLLEIARILQNSEFINNRDIDLVFYSTEEPPFFETEDMGSFKHAKSIKNDKNVELVIVLEMIGYFSEEDNSQNFPISFLKYFYPTKGNFIAVISNFDNSIPTRRVKSRFEGFLSQANLLEVYSMNAPAFIPGIDFSDHRNYWQFGIPAVMVTDTAFYRNKNYHTEDDTYEKLDYERMKEVVDATIATVLSL